MKESSSVTADDVDKLKKQGWNDRDMLGALAQEKNMNDHSIMMQVFLIDQAVR